MLLPRRNVLTTLSAAALLTAAAPLPSPAAQIDDNIRVYFGQGCFWHVQHELVQAEINLLNRADKTITATAGYAGGTKIGTGDKVCYHNAASVADYGKLGHAEVVALDIPREKFKDFAAEFCALFSKNGERPDQFGDRGPEYRNLVGIPGGTNSPLSKELVEVSKANGDKLDFASGKGDDADLRGLVWIMDSEKFPFYAAEQYHQFHDGFNWGEDYPSSYNKLVSLRKGTACPNGMLGMGVLGL